MAVYLTSYRPLIRYAAGRAAIAQHGVPPFVDYSCRREPDFQSVYPSITALCRAGQFAPRLHAGDTVVYLTCKGAYPNCHGIQDDHRRLTAIVRVIERVESHAAAAAWYRGHNLPLPRNCMVPGNPPLPLDMVAPFKDFMQVLRRWDLAYRHRSRTWPVFLICEASCLDLNDPPVITDGQLRAIFGHVPSTQNPPQITDAQLNALRQICGTRTRRI